MKRHKYILLPLSELTGALRAAIVARLKNYGNNPNALFKQDTVQSIVTYKRKLDGERFAVLAFLQKPSFIPERFREDGTLFNKIRTHHEMRDYVRTDVFEQGNRT